ncbi:MAG: TraU family protein [Candidatus Thiodiazotropha endolucinida]
MLKRFKRQIAALVAVSFLFNTLLSSVAMADDPGFGTDALIRTGINGMFDPSCGGYCITGACAHLNIRVTWRGISYYTIVSPRIRHAVPDLVISAYNNIGNEPWVDWRSAVGNIMDRLNTGPVAAILGVTDGMRGSQQLYAEQGAQQSVRFKEVDIVGHPVSIIPRIARTDGEFNSDIFFNFQVPSVRRLPSLDQARAQDEATPDDQWSLESMLDSGFNSVMNILLEQLSIMLRAFDLVRVIERLIEMFNMFTSLLDFYNNAMTLLETITRSTIYANLLNPRFQANRLFCPASVTPFQPYYLSYLDTMFWRTGFPITDGPISGSNHSATILNPYSSDRMGSSGEIWGHLYPRDGAVNQQMDPKAATVLAVRALDVLKRDVSAGSRTRVGVPLPAGFPRGGGRWQMIYPELRQCSVSPFYGDDTAFHDFMEENEHGGYAWNYYHVYQCCMNERGRLVATMNLPRPICFGMPGI